MSLCFFSYFLPLSLHSLNHFHFCFRRNPLVLLSSASYITTFTLGYGHPGLEIKILYVEKEMATHSSILAWKSPWTEEPGGLQSMGLHDSMCARGWREMGW